MELASIVNILQLYCRALTGRHINVQAAGAPVEESIGWVSEERPAEVGGTVFLPSAIETTDSAAEDFAIYKVYATHQAGHTEFGSFEFRSDSPGALTGNRRLLWEAQRGQEAQGGGDAAAQPLTDLQRYLDLFDDRKLAADLFSVLEDARIDQRIRYEYAGIRAPLGREQRRALGERPSVEHLPLRQGLVENLVRASLDGLDRIRWPAQLTLVMGAALSLLRQVQQDGARVEDSAELTLQLYELAMAIPNLLPEELPPMDWQGFDPKLVAVTLRRAQGERDTASAHGELVEPQAEGERKVEQPYESLTPVDFRGDFKQALAQLLGQPQNEAGQRKGRHFREFTPESASGGQELVQKSIELHGPQSAGGFMASLLREDARPGRDAGAGHFEAGLPEVQTEGKPDAEHFFYDEWDYSTSSYRLRWCRVVQRLLPEGDGGFFERTLSAHAGLAAKTRKQFELLRPEVFRKNKRLYDGEDLDIDLVVEYVAERRAGLTPSEKLYWRRNKVERDIAVAFLLDLSASTEEEVSHRELYRDEDGRFDRYLAWTWEVQSRILERYGPPKRIIDLEKESLVFLIAALEQIGDTYGIYGFSGYGREDVEFYIVKDLAEPFGDRVKRRIDSMGPVRSTRMGAAIRHASAKLKQYEARLKILFLVSDGRPQDFGYGPVRSEKEYAVRDTKAALAEAKRAGIVPFCLTMDCEDNEYLRTLCADISYEVVTDVRSLPSRLPALYRRLTG